jgi:hypothetical protein
VLKRVIWSITTVKALGPDFWSPHELRELPDSWLAALCELLTSFERAGRWPKDLSRSFVALIPKQGASHEGQLRPIALLPYIYRIWAACRKHSFTPMVRRLHGPRFKSARDQALEATQDTEMWEHEGHKVGVIYLDCSKCYERVSHDASYSRSLSAGAPPFCSQSCVPHVCQHEAHLRSWRAQFWSVGVFGTYGGVWVCGAHP